MSVSLISTPRRSVVPSFTSIIKKLANRILFQELLSCNHLIAMRAQHKIIILQSHDRLRGPQTRGHVDLFFKRADF